MYLCTQLCGDRNRERDDGRKRDEWIAFLADLSRIEHHYSLAGRVFYCAQFFPERICFYVM